MSSEEEQFQYSFFISLTQYESPASKLTNYHIFITPLPLKLTLISKSPYLTAHLKINYETGYTGRFPEKTQRRVPDHRNI